MLSYSEAVKYLTGLKRENGAFFCGAVRAVAKVFEVSESKVIDSVFHASWENAMNDKYLENKNTEIPSREWFIPKDF